MTVRNKFFLILILIAIETVVLTSIMYWMRNAEQAHIDRINFAHTQRDILLQITLSTNKQMRVISHLLLQDEPYDYSAHVIYKKQVQASLDRLQRLTRDEVAFVNEKESEEEKKELEALNNLHRINNSIADETEKAFKLLSEGRQKQAYKHFKEVIEKLYVEEFSVLIEEQVRGERSEVDQAQAAIGHKNAYYRRIAAGFSILIALITLTITFQIVAGLSRRLSLLVDASGRIGKGQLDTEVAIRNQDEFGQLASTLNSITSGLKESRIKIDAARDYLDNILSSMTDILFVISPQGGILKTNRAAEFLLGYTEEQLLDKPIETIFASGKGPLTHGSDVIELIQKGECYGVEQCYQARDGTHIPMLISGSMLYTQSGEDVGTLLVAQDISKLKESENQRHYFAYYDQLSGLPNRRHFDIRLQEAIDQSSTNSTFLALIVLDLDHFKMVNDSIGHDVGDELIKAVTERLKKRLEHEDTLFRIGGDEFSVILQHTSNSKDVAVIAQNIMAEIERPISINGDQIYISASLGISVYPNDANDGHTLFKGAESALHLAKEHGRNNYQFYKPELTTSSFEHFSIISNLRRALDNDEFEVYFQPQLLMTNNQIISAEALVRWRHPEKGLLSPGTFLHIAEKSNLISEISKLVLYKTCMQAKHWQDAGLSPITVAVNMAGQQIHFEDITEHVHSVLEKTGFDPQYLELEITENFFLGSGDRIGKILRDLDAMGITISIDDFGTGYSSLGYLQRLPINKLKIDQGFVKEIHENENDKAIVRAVIAMGHSLGLRIIAEGVETYAQKSFLEAEGCDEYQGYLFSKPVPADKFVELLKNSP
ncbi:MAG: EAL domain-containing protein [Candidatus Thiodiazotropha sp.]